MWAPGVSEKPLGKVAIFWLGMRAQPRFEMMDLHIGPYPLLKVYPRLQRFHLLLSFSDPRFHHAPIRHSNRTIM